MERDEELRDGGRFGALLRSYRSALGLTQEQLAERSSLSIRAIADMERSRTARPYRRSVQRLADALELLDPERELLQRVARSGGAEVRGPTARGMADGLAGAGTGPAVVPRQLPPAPYFVGRSGELEALTSLLTAVGRAGGASGTVTIWAIVGPAGVGKTTLATHWAHEVSDHFPDGQLYASLHGFEPLGDPVSPDEGIHAFLDALGVPPAQIPASAQARAGLYRSLLARRSMLIVLDNARDPDQVRPLLPGSPASLVVVTSRHQLTGLAAIDGARPLVLDVLTRPDAHELLARRLGRERLAREPRAAQDLVRLCQRLPLALAIVAARAAVSPALSLGELAADLRVTAGRLDAMDTGEAATSLRASFSCSYRALSKPAARMFRLLGVHPGPDITAAAAASLAGLPAGPTHALLGELTRCHLVSERRLGRYSFHDLVRGYAAEQARTQDSDPERRAAIHRVLDHYLGAAHAAALALSRHAGPIAADLPRSEVMRGPIASHRQAMAWFSAEYRVLTAVATQAASTGFDAHARQLRSALAVFVDRKGTGTRPVRSREVRALSSA
jgi:Helix-turn-helix domain/NB-ARC domain